MTNQKVSLLNNRKLPICLRGTRDIPNLKLNVTVYDKHKLSCRTSSRGSYRPIRPQSTRKYIQFVGSAFLCLLQTLAPI